MLRFLTIPFLCLAFFVGVSSIASTLKRGVPKTGRELLEITGNFVLQGYGGNIGYVLPPTNRDWYLEGIQCGNITSSAMGNAGLFVIQARTSTGSTDWQNNITSGVNTYIENVTKALPLGSDRLIPSGGYVLILYGGSECTFTFSEV